MEKKNNILTIVVSVVIGLCVIGGIYYLISNDNGKHYSNNNTNVNNNDNKTDDKNNTNDENNEEENNGEVENNEEENEDCDKYEFVFKSEKAILKDYSSLISKLDFSNKTVFYCAGDICDADKNSILENSADGEEESISIDFKAEIKNGKVFITTIEEDEESENKKEKTITLDIENAKSLKAEFNVADGVDLFVLDSNNNLYYYDEYSEKNNANKLYSNVKDFTVFEGNNYISVIEPSEGQNITVGLHTTDGKLMIGHFSKESFYDIKKVDQITLAYDDNDGNYFRIIVSQSKDYTYEKNNGKEIVVKEVFTSKGKLYIYTSSGELLSTPLDENTSYCNTKYTKVKSSSVKSVIYNDGDKKVTVKFSDGTSETYTYSYKIDI